MIVNYYCKLIIQISVFLLQNKKAILGVKMKKNKDMKQQKPNKSKIFLLIGGLFIIALAVLIGLQTGNQVKSGLPLTVNVDEAYELRENGAFVLDVRETHEWEVVHIPDVTLIPLGELEARLDELPKDQDILVVCRSGNRSATARDILLNAGFTNVTSMDGGMNDWVARSYEVASSD